MSLHPLEDIRKNADSSDGVGSFVQHDAFCAFSHGGVRDFRARRHAFLRQSFQNLSRPNHGNVGGLADPKDLLLDLRQTLVTAFHGEIPAGNHDPKGTRAHGSENKFGQIFETFASFNFENEPEMLAVQFFQALMKLPDVKFRADKGTANKVRVLDDELQRLQVIGGERRYVDARLGEVDALFSSELFT